MRPAADPRRTIRNPWNGLRRTFADIRVRNGVAEIRRLLAALVGDTSRNDD
jgi:hypothetical protein